MFMTTIVAVALGFAPIYSDGTVEPSADNYAKAVGPYTETIDRNGTHHVRGTNWRNGVPYEISVSSDGNVEAVVGERAVDFHVRAA